jgi:hypothetical protein
MIVGMNRYRIEITKAWRPDDRHLVHAGTYRVPDDMTHDMAQTALAKGHANMMPAAMATPRTKAASAFPPIEPRWDRCIVAATGPSLTEEVAAMCAASGWPIIAVNDAYRVLPAADVLYACDAKWWRVHRGVRTFKGEKWSSHDAENNDKTEVAQRHGLRLIEGHDSEGFSFDPGVIHYGSNSGFQAINLAILFGARRIVLVGFDMSYNGKSHFFGDHPRGLTRQERYEIFIPQFERAAARLPESIEIINCTPESALHCFPMMDLADALSAA